jgi:dihydrofolate reductase
MRKVLFSVANSLDNYIASPDGGVDWLIDSEDANQLLEEMWKPIDTVVMGRKTYEFSAEHGMDGIPGMKNYVLSSTLDPAAHKNVTIVNEDTAGLVRQLKSESGGDIFLMGGVEIARQCFQAGLIDELGLCIHPILLGKGVPLYLEMDTPINLELQECKPIAHGCVWLTYRVVHDKRE